MMLPTAKAVTLVGAGTQGSRLAYMWSKLGKPVFIIDKDEDQLRRAYATVIKFRGEAKAPERWGKITAGSLEIMETALMSSWLVVECVPEQLKIKKAVIQELDSCASPDIIVASNSSSYTIADIIEGLSLRVRERAVSLHSYWPPETTAIEVMGLDETRPEIITRLMQETKAHGFQPFHVRHQSTGYMFNREYRIWAAIKREALLTMQEGIASPQEIDGIYKAITRAPKGIFEQMDIAGLDVMLDIEKHYANVRSGLPTGPRELLQVMISDGKLGVKSGRGFYDHNKD